MAKSAIPGPLERRHLVERALPGPKARAIADAYLEQGRELEALDFLRQAGDTERLQEVRARALAAGDAFLLRAVAAATDTPPNRDEWTTLAEAAEAAGKERYALDARRQVGREED